ncbi:MAG: 30S ribosomal protein S6 [Phycisphaeraceae bacterium]|nr:30S ribosomal protein S6 [Phycisphaeraceae bacterium]
MSDSLPLYEGMFLFNPAAIGSSIATATEQIQEVLGRADAEVLAIYKWDERKLAYDIKTQKRGLYMLAYFRAEGSKLSGIERDVNLSEQITRVMVLRADHIGEVELKEAQEKSEQTQTEAAMQSKAEAERAEADKASETSEPATETSAQAEA